MNIIIVGCGKVGQKLAVQLNREKDQNITVVDLRHSVVQDIINQTDVMGIVGNGVSLETLTEAGIKNADILIAVTGSDELNLLTCLIAKKAGNCQTIARVRKPEYANEIRLIKEDLGLALVINPEMAAAREIARVLRFPSAIKIDTFAKSRAEVLKFKVPENSVLDNMVISDMGGKLGCDVLICGIERDDNVIIPDGTFVLRRGDTVSMIASPANATYFFKKIQLKTNRAKDTIIVGGGDTAYYLAYYLLLEGIRVKIIEQNPARCEELCQLLPKASIINADGSDSNILLEEGLEYTDSFIAMTNIDEENIMLSLYAKSKSNAKIITKINRIAYDEVISTLDLDTIIYPKDITAETIVKFVRAKKKSIGSNIETVHMILGGKAEALEFSIKENSPVSDIPIENLKLKKNILIACINRSGHIITPRGKDIIMPDDTVIVITTTPGLRDINDILE